MICWIYALWNSISKVPSCISLSDVETTSTNGGTAGVNKNTWTCDITTIKNGERKQYIKQVRLTKTVFKLLSKKILSPMFNESFLLM